MLNVLVVDDSKSIRTKYAKLIKEHGYKVVTAADGEIALSIIEDTYIDIIVTDISMPKVDGFKLVEFLRESHYDTPVIIVTGKTEKNYMEEGFKLGADDYMIKPVDEDELIWRIDAMLRRHRITYVRDLTIGDISFYYNGCSVKMEGQDYILPKKEFYLLYKLLSSPGRVFTRRQIMEDIWGIDTELDDHTLEVHISRLRERFKDNGRFNIVTVRGVGYKGVVLIDT